MTEIPQDPTALTPTKYHVLLMTAVVLSCDATTEVEAAQRALLEGPPQLDPRQLQWVVKYVSDKPIFLGEPGDEVAEQMIEEAASEEPAKPKLEIIT